MDVIQRNFFRLLRSGTFGGVEDAIEPMSPWKWNRLYSISIMHGVTALVYDGINNYANDFFLQIPRELSDKWNKIIAEIEDANRLTNLHISELFSILNKEQMRPILLNGQSLALLYDNSLHRISCDTDIYFMYSPQAKKAEQWARTHGTSIDDSTKDTIRYCWKNMEIEHHTSAIRLTNALLNRKLQNIINREIQCCNSLYISIDNSRIEIIPHTLNLLLIIVHIARYILSEGVCLKQIIDLGIFLRKVGDKVDFIKLQKWIDQLHLKRMSQLEGSILVHLFNFSKKEIPFMDHQTNENITQVISDLFTFGSTHTDNWYFTQGKNIFVRTSNTGAMTWQIRHLIKFLAYYPSEAATNFFSSFAHSISHIEE